MQRNSKLIIIIVLLLVLVVVLIARFGLFTPALVRIGSDIVWAAFFSSFGGGVLDG